MKVISSFSTQLPQSICTFYIEKNYEGASQQVSQGIFHKEQLLISNIRSVQVSEGASIRFYKEEDRSGECVTINKDIEDLQVILPFEPVMLIIYLQVSCYQNGVLSMMVPTGNFNSASLKNFDKMVIPYDLKVVFYNQSEEEIDHEIFTNTIINPISKVAKYNKFIVIPNRVEDPQSIINGAINRNSIETDIDFSSPAKTNQSLETIGIKAAGGCSSYACAEDACGGYACGGDACGGNACGGAACGGDACGGAACGGDACGADACGGAACVVLACGGDACAGAACGGNACGGAACGGDACAGVACGGDACGGNACAGAACPVDACPANACAGNACAVDACPANACAGDVCAINVIPIIPFI